VVEGAHEMRLPPQQKGKVVGIRQRRRFSALRRLWWVPVAGATLAALVVGTVFWTRTLPQGPQPVRLHLLANLRSAAPRYADAVIVLRFASGLPAAEEDAVRQAIVGALGDTPAQEALGSSGLQAVQKRIQRAVAAVAGDLTSVSVPQLLVLTQLPPHGTGSATTTSWAP
jgi:hypothetical protein